MIFPLAADWTEISSLATGAGTLVLAIATFAAVRSSQRSARIAEIALQEQRRPVLAPSRFTDPVQKIMFIERKWYRVEGGHGVAEHENGNVYLILSLRNVGSGIAVCQGWAVRPGFVTSGNMTSHLPEDEFRTQTRDLFVPAGDIGMWQGALRDRHDVICSHVAEAIDSRDGITIELLYSDQVGEQRTISRFTLIPFRNDETGEEGWIATGSRHWFLDRAGPRPERDVQAAAETIVRLQAERAQAEAQEAEAQEAEVQQAEDEATTAPTT